MAMLCTEIKTFYLEQLSVTLIGSRGCGLLVEADAMAVYISIPKPFPSGDATKWFKRFEICSKANQWNNVKKAVKLPTLLEGEALAI